MTNQNAAPGHQGYIQTPTSLAMGIPQSSKAPTITTTPTKTPFPFPTITTAPALVLTGGLVTNGANSPAISAGNVITPVAVAGAATTMGVTVLLPVPFANLPVPCAGAAVATTLCRKLDTAEYAGFFVKFEVYRHASPRPGKVLGIQLYLSVNCQSVMPTHLGTARQADTTVT